MIISHKSLHEVTRLLKCTLISSRELLRMFLNSQGVKDTNPVECQYPDTYKKGGKDFPFPNIEADDFPKNKEDLGIVMAYEEKWFKDFHDDIASDSAQTLMEAMSDVLIPGKPGEMLTRDGVFSYSSELVGLWQAAAPVIRSKPGKPTVIKMVTQRTLVGGSPSARRGR